MSAVPGPGRVPRPRALAAFAVMLALAGCASHKLPLVMPVDNLRPEVRLTQFPAGSGNAVSYVYELRWDGYDSDGDVAYFEYAVDPAPGDTAWVRTTDNRGVFTFRSTQPDSARFLARDYHVFVIVAVDNRAARSPVLARAFFSYTVAPVVQILIPHPHELVQRELAPASRIVWQGDDPDGQRSHKPVRYKFHLFSREDPLFDAVLLHPDTLRALFAPAFSSWDSVGGDTTSAAYSDLTPGADLLFALVAFDEAGAYTPIFSRNSNVLYFRVSLTGSLGPRITLFNEYFHYTYPSGGYSTDPSWWIPAEVVPGTPVDFNWSAEPPPGAAITRYRWALDIADLSDETPRSDENTDWHHWSQWLRNTNRAVVGPFAGGETHFFYVEAEDNNQQTSLGIVNFTVARASFEKDLLFVNDTRFALDRQLAGGCVTRIQFPSVAWPSSAELDTFLFARGGAPWRCYPAGSISPPGIFAGYRFDTLGTDGLRGGLLPLSVLARYRHVVWLVDRLGATFTGGAGQLPPTTLRLSTGRQGASVLGLYASLGGSVWVMGGGAASATQLDWDTHQPVPDDTYSSANGELAPGRFMWEVPHWRSEITARKGAQLVKSAAAVGGWPGAPDYSMLPFLLQSKTPATDPLPPTRLSNEFYQSYFDAEYLSQPNDVFDSTPGESDTLTTLDTLYNAAGAGLPGPVPAMSYYHGPYQPSVVFSGFPLWFFRRAQAIALADFVMQQVWGLPRDPVSREPGVEPPAASAARPARLPAAALMRKAGGRATHR